MLALFALHMAGVVTGLIDENLWGKNGAPPAIRFAAVHDVDHTIEAQAYARVIIIFWPSVTTSVAASVISPGGSITTALN